jgi:hypothetical protein
MVCHLLHHCDDIHDAELDLGSDLHDAAVAGDELLRWHAEEARFIVR